MTVSALAKFLHFSRAHTLEAIRESGITLQPRALHYTDTRPRTRHNYQPLTPSQTERVMRYVRARQGSRVKAT